ncbi:MAG: hypothetical protein ACLGIM_14040 [Alphaproteobacteria bacterium]|uniref:hypothetical protein n=1 Tax=Sphingobium sp. AntQ-1 TaxID=2930091 RepID=UPI00234F3E6E|nr:hypothetical protein [Sphingobium sp. AntQ-1]
MITWLRSLFAWRIASFAGVWRYEINVITGKRRASREFIGGYSPLDWDWLLTGQGMPTIDGIVAWRSSYRNTLPDSWVWS